MAKDPRNTRYKRLQTKVLNNRKRSYDFDATLSRVMQGLLPKQAAAPKKDNQAGVLQDLQNNFNKRLALMDKNNTEQLRRVQAENEKSTAALQESAEAERKKNVGITKSLGDAVQKLYNARKQSSAPTAPTTTSDETVATSEDGLSYTAPKIPTLATEEYVVPDDIITEHDPMDDPIKDVVSKAVLNIGQKVSIGNNKYRITNLFGPRTGANAVAGRGGGHSRGVDVVTHDASGNVTNAPIAIADGIIRSVSLEGSASPTSTGSASGGYVMNVELPNGKMVRYMHLSPDVEALRSGLIGKTVKRGDMLFEGDHSKWSGSGTANHTKISISSMDDKGNMLRDHDNPENDPTSYILYGKPTN